MNSSRLEVEASTAFAGNNFLFFLPVYVGPFDVRVWAQRKKSDGFGIEVNLVLWVFSHFCKELFHISVFENGRLVNLAEDSRFHLNDVTIEEGEMTFDKRSEAEGYLQSLHSIRHLHHDADEEFAGLTPEDTTEAQSIYWNLVGSDEMETLHCDSFSDPMGKVYWW